MGTEPILPVKWSVSINTMINFDGHGDGDGDGHGKCKQTFRLRSRFKIKTRELTNIPPSEGEPRASTTNFFKEQYRIITIPN